MISGFNNLVCIRKWNLLVRREGFELKIYMWYLIKNLYIID